MTRSALPRSLLDVHQATIAVSVAEGNGGEVRYVGEFPNTPEAMVKLVKQLRNKTRGHPLIDAVAVP